MASKKIAWGITGAGDEIKDVKEEMKDIKNKYSVGIDVFASKAGKQVLKMYNLFDEIEEIFDGISVEVNANAPFLAGMLYEEKYKGMVIAPATSNTVAKIANCIGDSLLTNSALQALKAYKPVHIMPVDLEAGDSETTLPNGNEIRIRVRKEDAAQVDELRKVDGIRIIEGPEKIDESFSELVGGE